MTEHDKLLRAIAGETSPTVALLLRRVVHCADGDPYYQGYSQRGTGALSVRTMLEAHGIDIDALTREKRGDPASAAAPLAADGPR